MFPFDRFFGIRSPEGLTLEPNKCAKNHIEHYTMSVGMTGYLAFGS